MEADDDQIVGSAEPLTHEQTKARLRELADWGVDLSLVSASLQESPTQRLDHMLGVLAFAQELQRAWKKREANLMRTHTLSIQQEQEQEDDYTGSAE